MSARTAASASAAIRDERHRLAPSIRRSLGVARLRSTARRGVRRRSLGDRRSTPSSDDERVAASRAPGWIAADAGDAELSRELVRCSASLIAGLRDASSCSTRSRICAGDARLRLQRQRLRAVGADDRDRVRVDVEAGVGARHVVGDDEVDVLRARASRVARATTSSVSAAKPTSSGPLPDASAPLPEVAEDVRRLLQHQRQRVAALRHLLRGALAPACSRRPRPP